MRKVTIIMLLALCLPAFADKAQSEYPFIHINSSNSGLSYDDCRVIFQDSRGFMWFGTYMGLNRYDGMRFTVYDRDDLCGISDFIHTIEEDNTGNLWIGTDGGLLLYDYEADMFRVFDLVSDKGTVIRNKVNHIQKDSRGVIWVAVNGQGLFSYNPQTDEFSNYFVQDGRMTLPTNIRTFEPDHHGGLWVALYYAGLYHCDASISGLTPVRDSDNVRLADDNIEGIVVSPTENDVIYLSSVKNGLCRMNIRSGKMDRLISVPENSLPNGLFCHHDRTLWMSTTNGLYKYEIASGTYSVMKADINDRFSISHDYIFSVFLDKNDGLWVSTKYNGINYCSTAQKWFRKHYMLGDKPLKDWIVSGFVETEDGNLLITTEKGGILKYDINHGSLSSVVPEALKGVDLIAPCIDGRYVWLGSMRGLYRYDFNSRSLKFYDSLSQNADLQDDRVGMVFRSDNGTLYVGTTLGLSYYDRANDCFETIPAFDGRNITSMSEDSFGMLWVSTYADGIFHYSPQEDRILKQFSAQDPQCGLPTNKISSIFIDSKDRVWAIGLTYGFSVYESSVGRFVTYDSSSCPGMCTDVYFYALEDDSGHIWISSDRGLLEVDPQTMHMTRYTTRDGLLDDVMKRGAVKTEDGALYFASQSGFIEFRPSEFVHDRNHKVVISGFTVADKPVKPSDPDSPLSGNVDLMDKISLKAGQNSFGFTFSLMNCMDSKVRLQCMLEGYEKNWTDISSEHQAYFYNVPAGKYKLLVRCSFDGSKWHNGHADVDIVIAEKFWKSNMAIVIYLLLGFAVIALVAVRINVQSKRKMKEREEADKIAREKAFLREKMEFFSEVIHEIKTPLTLMTTPLRTIMESKLITDDRLRDNLEVINNSTNYMGSLVKELLDYMSVEEHGYVLDIRNIDIVANLKKTCGSFAEIAKERGLSIKVDSKRDSIVVGADRKALVKVFNNLIHNAVKYAGSWIRISINEYDDHVVMCFANDGPQIPVDRRADIFKPFVKFTAEHHYAAQSFGIGLSMARKLIETHDGTLILTDNEEYTEFIVTLPVNLKESDQDSSARQPETNPKLPYILLVEDSLELAGYLRKELYDEYNVIHASSAEKGLKMLGERTVDLILTDVGLPGMSGVDFCAELHENKMLSHIPVIVLSAMSSVDIKVRCVENGAAMYIEKPFSMNYLKACIDSVMKTGKRSDDVILDAAAALKTLRRMNIADRDTEFAEKLDEVILKNISDDTFGSKQLEEAMFMSRSTFARKIKDMYDVTPNEYLKNKRLSVAAQMLKQKNVRINEVSQAVGFRSASYFSRCFKDVYGMLPAEYVNEMNK